MSEKPMRTFVALAVPEAARQAACAYQERWRLIWPAGSVSWTKPGAFHLTLRFLGDIQPRQAEDVAARLVHMAGAAPVPARFCGPLGFPNLRRPRVLALETAGPPELAALADDLDRALKGLHLERRDKPFRAHLTLGRVRRFGLEAAQVPEWPGDVAWLATRIVFFQSFLGPGGSRYAELAAVELAGGGLTGLPAP